MKRILAIILAVIAALSITAGSATAAKTLDGRTYDSIDPYCYHNAEGDARIYTAATVVGTTNYIHTYDKRLMVSADGVNWYPQSVVQSWQAPSGYVNYGFWSGPPALNTGTFLYIVQTAVRYLGQPVNWTNADRSAGKWITCYDA